ncbi:MULTISPECIES: hypothetical protein [unclassified Clostridium]|uniref:hypothetical protein n=1 Tax=unclassified Clostridium TaxID=2614128 RepID=UPI0013FBB28E|nr:MULTISPECIES: hypothetical protein [unclassified Clostridium]NFR86475.1 hypothetical protein [Clostridium botulinum]NFR89285.1 hypothetical protein [Clostridium botulinum]NFS09840.1 hypothetical protein [Clostridium botulinum]NFT97690.1 hypothetical protein [Clostridium botulinum]
MKVLGVYNTKGKLIFIQINSEEQYASHVEDIEDAKEVIGINLETKKFILVDKLATTEEKEQLKRELESKNLELEKKNKELEFKSKILENKENELNSTKQELLSTQATVVDVTYNNLIKENGGI